MKLSKREIALIGLLILLGSGYLLDCFIFRPLHAQTNHISQENRSLSKEVDNLEHKISKYADIGKKETIMAEYREMMEKIPSYPMIPMIIEELELSAEEDHISIQSIKYKEDANTDLLLGSSQSAGPGDPQLQAVNFQIIAQGSYYNLLSFLLKIESAPRIYVINSSKMTMGKKDKAPAAETPNVPAGEEGQTAESAIEIETPESQIIDQNNTILVVDFNAFYDN